MTVPSLIFFFSLILLISIGTDAGNTYAPTYIPNSPTYIPNSAITIPNINTGAATCPQGITFTTIPLGVGTGITGTCTTVPTGAVCTPYAAGGQACYVSTVVKYSEPGAATACAALGGSLVNIQSFAEFYFLAITFPNQVVWINSWQGDAYSGRCIDFTTGGGGTAAITMDDCGQVYVGLCEFKNITCTNGPSSCITGTNLLINGGFELPVCNQPFCSFASIPGWVVLQADNSAGLVKIDTTNLLPCIEGRQCLDLASSGQVNQYFQSFQTVVGASYQLNFYFTTNPSCSATPFTVILMVTVFDNIGTTLQSTPYSSTAGGTSILTTLNWRLQTTQFVATSTLTTIRFSGSTPVPSCGPIIDNVSVTCLSSLINNPITPIPQPIIIPNPNQPIVIPTYPNQPVVVPTYPTTQPVVVPTYPTTQPIITPTYPITQPIVTPNYPITQPIVIPSTQPVVPYPSTHPTTGYPTGPNYPTYPIPSYSQHHQRQHHQRQHHHKPAVRVHKKLADSYSDSYSSFLKD